jgi:hypothetical protein
MRIVPWLVAAALVVGCSSSSGSNNNGPGDGGGGGGGGGGSITGSALCNSLTTAQVGAVLGITVAPGVASDGGGHHYCLWHQVMATGVPVTGFTFTAIDNGASLYSQACGNPPQPMVTVTAASGVGDTGCYAEYTGSSNNQNPAVDLHFMKGTAAFIAELNGDVPPSMSETWEKTLAVEALTQL